ncbi:MAG: LssY C-terminal domain-containing protein, partial [Mesorhizobium sp.]|nr:LssY C-terminal domain-containing protein [Mesorhizobium sp.]
MGRRKRIAIYAGLAFLAAYAALAYVAAPMIWSDIERAARLAPPPMRTTTLQGIPGDPINLGLVGEKESVIRAFAAIGWTPADAVTLKTSVEIGLSVVLGRPYADAPVSTLVFEGRGQDLAFEKEDGASAGRRHHLRLWLTRQAGEDGRPLWLGSASFDRDAGLSHDTGQFTHHIAPDVDAERDLVIATLDA